MTIFSLPTFSYSPPPPPSPLLHTLGARVGVRPPPPLGGRFATFSPYVGALYCYVFLLMGNLFYHVGAFLVHFSPYVELILPCGGPFWYIFLLMGNFFTMWGSFFSMWGPLATFSSLLGPFYYHVGRQSYHVGDFLLRFSFYWELVLPCGGIFANFFSIWDAFLYIWGAILYIRGAFLYIWGGLFCTYGGNFGLPPRTNIPARPRVPIAIPHHIIMPVITV